MTITIAPLPSLGRILHVPGDVDGLDRSEGRDGQPPVPPGLRQLPAEVLVPHVRQDHRNARCLLE